jgi:ubiquinone/menaquinone biosynthesis C-methylase UbiE
MRAIDLTKTQNFVKADALHLPFRDRSIKAVRCLHVLEHLENPLKGLREMKRVSQGYYFICVPNFLNERDSTKTHLYTWTRDTFNNLLRQVFRNRKVILTPYELIGVVRF